MSESLRFMDSIHTKGTLRKWAITVTQLFVVLALVLSLVMTVPTRVSAAGTTYYVDNTNPACYDGTGATGTLATPFCTIVKGASRAKTPGDTVYVLHGTYAETIFIQASGDAIGGPITFKADPGVTVTGNNNSAFAFSARSYITIDGFNVAYARGKAIHVTGSNNIIIKNNHIHHSGDPSNTSLHVQGIVFNSTTDSQIINNVSDHNTCTGIRLADNSNNNLVANNVSFANASVVKADAAGIDVLGSSYNTIKNNILYGNEDSGISIYINSEGTQSTYNVSVGNLIFGNGDHGIDHNNSPYNSVIGNTIQGNGTVGINFEGTPGTGSHHGTILNNISVGNGFAPPTASFGGNIRVDTASIDSTVVDYNLVYRQSATVQYVWNSVNYTSQSDFRTATGQEVHGYQGDPLLVAPIASVIRSSGGTTLPFNGNDVTGDYYLQAGSPAIDRANSDAPNHPEKDIIGNSRVDDPAVTNHGAGVRDFDDLGAYEYQLGTVSSPAVTTIGVPDATIAASTVVAVGDITTLGMPTPTQHGFVYSTSPNPTIASSKTLTGPVSVTGPYTAEITGLLPNTLYYLKAYVTNSTGTFYGDEVSFTTKLLPTLTTEAVTAITSTTATGNGTVVTLGIPNPTQHGVVWGLNTNPTVNDNKTTDGPVSATGAFTSSITGLTPGTTYHVRAYASSQAGVAYGNDVTFTTSAGTLAPIVTTQEVSDILTTTATGNGTIVNPGAPNATQYGVVWDVNVNPTVALTTKTEEGPATSTGAFTSSITGLTPGMTYHVRAYATYTLGTVYGDDVTFTTLKLPTVTTQAVTNITQTTATGNGNVTNLGVPNPTQHGVVWSTTANPTIANSKTTQGLVDATGAFTSNITGLTPGVTYHVRAYATNAAGTVYGDDVTFTALKLPTVTTQAVTNITINTATGNGTVTDLGITNPTQHGVVWSTSANPTTADNKTTDGAVSVTGAFTSAITGLKPNTTYHVRAYATNAAGTVYGADVTFTTLKAIYLPIISR